MSAEFQTIKTINDFLAGFFEGIPEGSMSGTISTNVGKDENIHFAKDKQAFAATQFQSLDIIGNIPQLPIYISNVRIGESEGRGKGIFATHDIPDGSIITFYPADMCEIYDQNSRYLYYSEKMIEFTQDCEEVGQEIFRDSVVEYSLDLDSNRKIVALKTNTSNEAFLGHIANDGAVDFSSKKAYLTSSIRAHNCVVMKIPDQSSFLVALVATRNIVAGEEIFRTYSTMYWFRMPPNIQYVEFEDEKCNEIARTFAKITNEDVLASFVKFKKSKRICAYVDGSNVIALAFLTNKKGSETDTYKYSSIHHHPDKDNYRFNVSFMNKADETPHFVFSDFISSVGKRYPCIVFSKEEIPILLDSGYKLI
jgi:hypothetical protein